MKYNIEFHNINNTKLDFYHDSVIGTNDIDLNDNTVKYNDIQLRLPSLDDFKILTAEKTIKIIGISYTSTQATFEFATAETFVAGDYLYVKDELFLWNNGLVFDRAQNGTRRINYIISESLSYITAFKNGKSTPLGTEVTIRNGNNIVYKGFITGLQTSGAGYFIDISDLINKLNSVVYINATSDQFKLQASIDVFWGFDDIIDWTGLQEYKFTEIEVDSYGYLKVNAWELLEQLLKTIVGVLTWNSETEKYDIVHINEFNSFANYSAEVQQSELLETGYTLILDNLLTDIELTYNGDNTFTINNTFFAGANNNKVKQIDCSNLAIEQDDAQAICSRVSQIFNLRFGTLEYSFKPYSVKVGQFYGVSRYIKEKLGTNDVVCQCISTDGVVAQFSLISSMRWSPIAPEIKVKCVGIDSGAGAVVFEFDPMLNYPDHVFLDEYLKTVWTPYPRTLQTDYYWNSIYYNMADNYLVYNDDQTVYETGDFNVVGVTFEREYTTAFILNINTVPFVIDDYYYITFPVQASQSVNQQKYLNNGSIA